METICAKEKIYKKSSRCNDTKNERVVDERKCFKFQIGMLANEISM